MASIHRRVRDTRLMARPLDARQGGCFDAYADGECGGAQEGSRGFMGSMNKISLVGQRNRNKKKSAAEIIAMPPLLASMHTQSEQDDGRASLLLPPIELQPPRHPHDRSPETMLRSLHVSTLAMLSNRRLFPPAAFLLPSRLAQVRLPQAARPSRACLLHSSSPRWAAPPKFPTLLPQTLLFLGETH